MFDAGRQSVPYRNCKGPVCALILLPLLFGSVVRAEGMNGIAGRMGVASNAMVAACNAGSALAGAEILKQGAARSMRS
jgi:hypothetical protein